MTFTLQFCFSNDMQALENPFNTGTEVLCPNFLSTYWFKKKKIVFHFHRFLSRMQFGTDFFRLVCEIHKQMDFVLQIQNMTIKQI